MVHHFWGNDPRALWIMKACVLVLTLPPLVIAWQTIRNRYKPLVYALFFIGVPLTVFVLIGIVLEGLIIKQHVLADTLWGMPYMVVLAEVLATVGYASLKAHLWQPARSGPSGAGARSPFGGSLTPVPNAHDGHD